MAKRVRKKEVVPIEENATEIPTVEKTKPIRKKRNVASEPVVTQNEVIPQPEIYQTIADNGQDVRSGSVPDQAEYRQINKSIFTEELPSIRLYNGMRLNKVRSTCSMYELGDVGEGNLDGIKPEVFENSLRKAFTELGVNYFQKAIIYNCSNSNMHKILKKLGFKPQFTYKGYSSYSKVTTFVKRTGIERGTRSWLDRLLF